MSGRRIAVLHGLAFCRFCAKDAAQQDQPDEKQPEYRHAEMDGNQAHQQEADDGLDGYGNEAGHNGAFYFPHNARTWAAVPEARPSRPYPPSRTETILPSQHSSAIFMISLVTQ